jgi:hypothetical protein
MKNSYGGNVSDETFGVYLTRERNAGHQRLRTILTSCPSIPAGFRLTPGGVA